MEGKGKALAYTPRQYKALSTPAEQQRRSTFAFVKRTKFYDKLVRNCCRFGNNINNMHQRHRGRRGHVPGSIWSAENKASYIPSKVSQVFAVASVPAPESSE